MPPIVPLDFIGSAWSLWPSHSDREGCNLVSGTRKITSDILTVCLLRKGEDPIHPDLGLAPDLFEPLSNYAPQYWVYNVQNEIRRWVAGIEQLSVDVVDYEDYKNRLTTEIRFVPKQEADNHILTFGWYAYTGAIWNQELDTFLEDITLDGSPFQALR